MDKYIDKNIYRKAKKIADKKYETHSAYKSMYISKLYKDLGGRYKGKNKKNLKEWRNERWVEYNETTKKLEPCGSRKAGEDWKHACRPYSYAKKNIDKMKKANKIKRKDPNKRIIWSKL